MGQGLIRLLVINLLVMIGIPFCFIGGLTAFLITYESYLRGNKPDKRLAFRVALQTALITLALFIILTIGIGFFVSRIVLNDMQ